MFEAGFPVAGKGAAREAAAGIRVCCCCCCSSSGSRAAEFQGAEKGQHGRQVLVLGCVAVALGGRDQRFRVPSGWKGGSMGSSSWH